MHFVMLNFLSLPSSGEIWPNTLLRTCCLVVWCVWLALAGVGGFGSEIASVKIRIFDEITTGRDFRGQIDNNGGTCGLRRITAVSAVSVLPGLMRRGGG